MNRYLNGIQNKLKKDAAIRAAKMKKKFEHDKAYAEKVKELYLKECIADGVFEDEQDAKEAVSAVIIRSQLGNRDQW